MTQIEQHPRLPVSIYEVSGLSDPRLDRAIDVLESSSYDMKSFATLVGGHDELRGPLSRTYAECFALIGHLYVAMDDSGVVVGTVSFLPPGSNFLEDEVSQKRFQLILDEFSRVDPELRAFWDKNLSAPKEAKLFPPPDENLPGDFAFQNWRFVAFAVSKDVRHRGVGTALLKVGIDRAIQEGRKVCAETLEDNLVEMYEKLGFTIVGERRIEGSSGQSGFIQRFLVYSGH